MPDLRQLSGPFIFREPIMRCAVAVCLLWIIVARPASGEDASAAKGDVKPAFEQLVVTFEPSVLSNHAVAQLRIEATGKCWFKAEGTAARGDQPGRSGGIFSHQLSDDRIRRLNRLLTDTEWLTVPGGDGLATQTDAATIRLALTQAGKATSMVCVGERPAPYAELLRELQGIEIQEHRIYLHDYVAGREGRNAWQDVGRELAAMRGESYAKSAYRIEYERYLPIARRIIREFHGEPDDELLPAIRLIGTLTAKSELTFLHRLSDDRSMPIRSEVAWALGRIHDPESLPVLIRMMPARGSSLEVGYELIQWGEDAVPDIVSLIGQSTDNTLTPQERTTGEFMIRAYLENWNKLPKPVSPAVIEAVQRALAAKDPQNGLIRIAYHEEFLRLVSKP